VFPPFGHDLLRRVLRDPAPSAPGPLKSATANADTLSPPGPKDGGPDTLITKTGSGHGRRLLVEAAWHYRRAPAKCQALKRRQAGQPAHVIAISWHAQQRLHRTWRRQDSERGKRRTIVAVAVARELAGFCWAAANAD
jgi:hypothetical protein